MLASASPPWEKDLTTALVCTALLGLLLFSLGLVVSLTRSSGRRAIGHADSPADPLHKAIRAHGNTAEYAPMLAVLILALGALAPSTWMLAAMWASVASRYLIAAGLVVGSLDEPNPLRFVGAAGTYLSGLALCAALVLSL